MPTYKKQKPIKRKKKSHKITTYGNPDTMPDYGSARRKQKAKKSSDGKVTTRRSGKITRKES